MNEQKISSGYDSDMERQRAHMMFVDDVQEIRKYFIETMDEQIRIQEEMQTNFNREREFFLTSAKQSADNSNGLQDIIDQLKNELEEERNYSEKVWADEQVSLLCQKALYTHKYMNIA